MPSFDTVSELVLYVTDVGRTTAFYTDVFGLEIEAGDPDHGFVRFDTDGCSLCLHAGGDADSSRDSSKFVFAVEDVEDARDYLRDHDVEVGRIRSPVPGTHVCDGRDPEGNPFSIESTGGSH